MDDFRLLITEAVPSDRLELDWHDPDRDPEGNYSVDCKVNRSAVPWFLFGIGSDASCRLATITCLTFEKWNVPFRSMAIFRDQAAIGRKPLTHLTDVIGKQFSSLDDRNRIVEYINSTVLAEPVRS